MYVWIYLVISLDLKTAAKLQFLVPLYSVQGAGCSQAEKLCNGKKVGRSCMNLHTHTLHRLHTWTFIAGRTDFTSSVD